MKNKKNVFLILIPVIITFCLYMVFYSRIESKPEHAGFWFILALGIAIGVALTRTILWCKEKDI
jgi:hypothetical protein